MTETPARRRVALEGRGRSGLLWFVAFFIASQLGLAVIMERRQPGLRDPEYGIKLARLRSQRRKDPDRPLFLVLGSSRAGYGFRTELMSDCQSAAGKAPLVFNFALPGSGPLLELVCLRRLLAEGVRPARIFLEVVPFFLHQEGSYGEENWINVHSLGLRDVSTLGRYYQKPYQLYRTWFRSRVIPWFSNRYGFLSRYAPRWLPWDHLHDDVRSVDRWGWKPWPRATVTPEEYRKGVETARWQFSGAIDGYRVTDVTDRAMREMLGLCRRHDVPVTLYLMPEGTECRSWYTPAMTAHLENYLDGLKREYGVSVANAHTWVEDSGFFDSHHLLPHGATAFSQRFRAEVIEPLVQGKFAP